MQKLTRQDLYSLEEYAQERPAFRARVLEHKKPRAVHLGPNATLYFEDRLTMQYQIQEMLRVERIFEREGIEDELGAYNPLIPDGANWKATFMIEVPDEAERRKRLTEWLGIEDRVYVQVDGFEPVYAIPDEDMERADEIKTSSVHFMRFELGARQAAAVKGGAAVAVGIDHPQYNQRLDALPADSHASLAADLD